MPRIKAMEHLTTGDLIRDIYYKTVPAPIRCFINGRRRNDVFGQAMLRFLDDPKACLRAGNTTLTELIYGWGNEAWSAREEFLACCINYAFSVKGPILECGSGLSTLLIAAIAQQTDQPHWVLEHKPVWVNRVQTNLDIYGLNTHITTCVLKDYGGFCWYDAPLKNMPPNFSMIVCDGPPSRGTNGGRYGLAPVMRNHITPGCVILLDDAYRQQERDIAERWQKDLGGTYSVEGINKPYFVITLPPH